MVNTFTTYIFYRVLTELQVAFYTELPRKCCKFSLTFRDFDFYIPLRYAV